MKEALSRWITQLLTVGVVTGMLGALVPAGTMKKAFSFAAALALMLTFLSPLSGMNPSRLSPGGLLEKAAEGIGALTGKETENTSERIIETGLAAYISKQAEETGVEADIVVVVGEEETGGTVAVIKEVIIKYRREPDIEAARAFREAIYERYGIDRGMQKHRYAGRDVLPEGNS